MTSEDEGDYNEINNNVAINNNNKNAIVNKSNINKNVINSNANVNNENAAKPQQQISIGNRYGQLRWVFEYWVILVFKS